MVARFERCRFDRALLDDWSAGSAEFVECHFAGRLVQVKFSGEPAGPAGRLLAPFRRTNEFRGNDFSEAELIDCRVSGGFAIEQQSWPARPGYIVLDRLQDRIGRARHAVLTQWSEGLDRERALNLLDVYSTFDYAKQQGLVVHRGDVDDYGPWAERLWTLLEGS